MAFFVTVFSSAAVPESINYQGYLKQDGAVVNGTKSMTFTLYDAAAGGAALCTSGAQSVTVANGLFSYKIGSAGCDLTTINWDNPVYLEVAIDGAALTPREQMAGMSYLLQKQASDVAFTPAGDVAAATVQSAIAELDSEKLSKTGGTVTGTLTATAFAGDGSALTGINASALDHGTMGGLSDDDHTQYFNLSQAETVTGIPAFNGGVTGTSAPFTVDSTFLVANLNSDLLDGQEGSFYLNTGTAHAGDVTGVFNTLDIASGVVGSTEITDNSVTATDLLVNVVSSIDAVTTDGGNIDLVAGAGVTITPDDTANTITIAGDFSAVDHGSITGLGDDDHTQYVKDAGDTMTGGLSVSFNTATSALSIVNAGGGDAIAASGNITVGSDTGTDGYDVNFYGNDGTPDGRMYWDASKLALRAGRDQGANWTDANTGLYSIAFGINTRASGIASTALGWATTANGNYSLAAGNFLTADTTRAIVIGNGIDTSNRIVNNTASSLMIGFNSTIPTLFVGPGSGAGTLGKVGIGTTTPANLLDVEGGAAIGATYSGASAAPANGLIVEGNVGIGKTGPATALDVNGTVTVSGGAGNGVYSTTSGAGTSAIHGSISASSGFALRGTSAASTGGAAVYGESTGIGAAILAFNNSTGVVYEGNSTGTGNLLVLKTNNVDTFVIDHNGVVTVSGCPASTVSTGDFCIENTQRANADWITGVGACRAAGRHMCSAAELMSGCMTGLIGFNNAIYYWASDPVATLSNRGTIIRNTVANCAGDPILQDVSFGSFYPFYCCINK